MVRVGLLHEQEGEGLGPNHNQVSNEQGHSGEAQPLEHPE